MCSAFRGRGAVALLAVLLAACAMLVLAAPRASATSDTVPIDEPPSSGGPCDTIPGNGVPTCGGGTPPGGTLIPCIDPALPCAPYDPGEPRAPIDRELPPFDTSCLGFVVAHQAGHPAVIREQIACPENRGGVTLAAFRAAFQTMANTPECGVGDLVKLHYTQRDSNANGRYEDEEADDPFLAECFAADAQRNPIGPPKHTLTLP